MATASDHYVLADSSAEAFWFLGTLATLKADGARTASTLSVVEFTHPAGFATPLHVHQAEDEAFYVLAGAMRGVCGAQPWHATAGSFVWLPRGIPHGYAVEGEEPLRTLAISVPAGFDRFVAEVGERAAQRVIPPPAAPDVEKLLAAAAAHGQEILGPLNE